MTGSDRWPTSKAGSAAWSLAGVTKYKSFEVLRSALEGLRAQKLALNPIKDQGYLDAARETVCPLQSACGHSQAMSGVFSIASHSVLQYFPEVTLQEQTGWAHFLLSAIESPFHRT
jgi:hypothetical protein